jgi:hypothetical protein
MFWKLGNWRFPQNVIEIWACVISLENNFGTSLKLSKSAHYQDVKIQVKNIHVSECTRHPQSRNSIIFWVTDGYTRTLNLTLEVPDLWITADTSVFRISGEVHVELKSQELRMN